MFLIERITNNFALCGNFILLNITNFIVVGTAEIPAKFDVLTSVFCFEFATETKTDYQVRSFQNN